MMYFLIQVLCMFLSLMALSQASVKTATKFDKVTFGLFSLVFIILATFIEGVLK